MQKKMGGGRYFAVLLVLLLLVSAVAGVHISDIDVEPDDYEVDKDDEISVDVEFSGTPCNSKVMFFLDDVLFSSKNLNCDTDDIESGSWDLKEREVDCGTHEIRVELFKSGEKVQTVNQTIRIGRVPEITISPERPLVDKEVIIEFVEEDGTPARNLVVDIYWVKDGVGSADDYDTGSDGKLKFTPKETGEYRFTVDDSNYCGSESFYAKKTLIIDGPDPSDPKVGDPVTFALSGPVGAKLVRSDGETTPLYTTISGGVNFTVDEGGTYTLVLGELSTVYWSVNETVVIEDKAAISLLIEPETPVIGKSISMNTRVNGEALSGVDIEIEDQTGDIKTYTTDLNGVMNFIPSSIGLHRVYAKKKSYKESEKDFRVYNSLHVFFEPASPSPGQEVTLIAKNQLGYLIDGVNVFIPEIPVGGKTDNNGMFKFTPVKVGRYTVTLNKESYWDVERELNISGLLELSLDKNVIEIGESVTILALDENGNQVSTSIRVRKPDGSEEGLSAMIYTPGDVGKYQISAGGDGYVISTKELTVNTHPLEVNTAVEGDELVIKTESTYGPVAGITLLLKTATKDETLVTNENGISRTSLEEGAVRIIANTMNVKKDYGIQDVTQEIRREHNYGMLALFLIGIVIFAVVAIFVSGSKGDKGTGTRKKSSVLEGRDKGKSSLSNL